MVELAGGNSLWHGSLNINMQPSGNVLLSQEMVKMLNPGWSLGVNLLRSSFQLLLQQRPYGFKIFQQRFNKNQESFATFSKVHLA
eukprot:5222337-Amphidinium_carterae.1